MKLALGFDPGERHLGVALLAYDPAAVAADPHNDLLYEVRAYELWDLQAGRNNDGSRTACLDRLAGLLTNREHPLMWALLSDPKVDVYIEHQEGFNLNRPEIGAALMPMCSYAGAIFAIYRAYGHQCVRLTGKKSKWGWSSFLHTKDYALLPGDDAKRARRKACATYYTWDLMERQLATALSNDGAATAASLGQLALRHMNDQYRALPFDDKAHIADSILLVMFQVRKRYRKHAPNTIRASTWPTLAARAEAITPLRAKPVSTGSYKGYGRKKQTKKRKK
jgi:hypothetical protein